MDSAGKIPEARGDRPAYVAPAAWNAMREEVNRSALAPVAGAPYQTASTQGGRAMLPAGVDEMWVRLTSAGPGAQSWKQVSRQGGAWVDAARAGTTTSDAIFEANNDPLDSGKVVIARRAPKTGEWIYYRGGC